MLWLVCFSKIARKWSRNTKSRWKHSQLLPASSTLYLSIRPVSQLFAFAEHILVRCISLEAPRFQDVKRAIVLGCSPRLCYASKESNCRRVMFSWFCIKYNYVIQIIIVTFSCCKVGSRNSSEDFSTMFTHFPQKWSAFVFHARHKMWLIASSPWDRYYI